MILPDLKGMRNDFKTCYNLVELQSTYNDIAMNLDISTAVQVAFFLAAAGFILSFILGIRAMGRGGSSSFSVSVGINL